jgi:hypothetical protein
MSRALRLDKVAGFCLLLAVIVLAACDSDTTAPPKADRFFTEEELRRLPPISLSELMPAYESVKQDHPAVDERSERFARLLYERILNQPALVSMISQTDGTDGTIEEILGRKLNPTEIDLVMNNPYCGYRTGLAGTAAGVHSEAAFPGLGRYQTRKDAFRHAFWNALMVFACDEEWAERFATAHEEGRTDVDDRTMDLNNNAIGRQIGVERRADGDLFVFSVRSRILSYPVVCLPTDVRFDLSRFVIMQGCPTVVATTYQTTTPGLQYRLHYSFNGQFIGTVTQARERHEFEMIGAVSGEHVLTGTCEWNHRSDEGYGCGFEFHLSNGAFNASWSSPCMTATSVTCIATLVGRSSPFRIAIAPLRGTLDD